MAHQPVPMSIAPYKKGSPPMKFDLAPLLTAERRLFEITFADKTKAKDLFSEFMRGYNYAAKLHSMVKYHVALATNEARKRRAVLLLDFIPTWAKEKGLSSARNSTGSEDVRNAFYYSDPEYLTIEDGRAALEAAQELLFAKMMSLRDAAGAVKALLSPSDVPTLNNATVEPNAYGRDETPDPMGAADPPPPLKDVDGFGTPGH